MPAVKKSLCENVKIRINKEDIKGARNETKAIE